MHDSFFTLWLGINFFIFLNGGTFNISSRMLFISPDVKKIKLNKNKSKQNEPLFCNLLLFQSRISASLINMCFILINGDHSLQSKVCLCMCHDFRI